MLNGIATAAPPKVVSLPNSNAQCFAPWASNTKLFQYPAKKGPYRIALANGYIANTWRIQMIKTAKAYAAQPDVAAKLNASLANVRTTDVVLGMNLPGLAPDD